MGGKSGGSAPDTKGAARIAGEEARWLAREQTMANRPNQSNPWGSTTWTRTPINPDGSAQQPPSWLVNFSPPGQGPVQGPPTPGGSGGGAVQRVASAAQQFGGRNQAYRNNQSSGGAVQSVADQIVNGLTEEGTAQGPGMFEWTQTETLNPELQASLDAQFGQQRNRTELAQQLSGQLSDQMSTPFDFGAYGDAVRYNPASARSAAEAAAYGRATSRLDPQFEKQRQDLDIQLRNRGLRAGDQQYESEMDRFNRAQNDAYEQARMGATLEGRQEAGLGMQQTQLANQLRTQEMEEGLFARGYTLDEINRLMQGQEVQGSTPSSDQPATIADMLRG